MVYLLKSSDFYQENKGCVAYLVKSSDFLLSKSRLRGLFSEKFRTRGCVPYLVKTSDFYQENKGCVAYLVKSSDFYKVNKGFVTKS